MKIVSNEQFEKMLNLCKCGKHKFRENNLGVVWCVRCGTLSTKVGFAEKLTDEDKIVIKND